MFRNDFRTPCNFMLCSTISRLHKYNTQGNHKDTNKQRGNPMRIHCCHCCSFAQVYPLRELPVRATDVGRRRHELIAQETASNLRCPLSYRSTVLVESLPGGVVMAKPIVRQKSKLKTLYFVSQNTVTRCCLRKRCSNHPATAKSCFNGKGYEESRVRRANGLTMRQRGGERARKNRHIYCNQHMVDPTTKLGARYKQRSSRDGAFVVHRRSFLAEVVADGYVAQEPEDKSEDWGMKTEDWETESKEDLEDAGSD